MQTLKGNFRLNNIKRFRGYADQDLDPASDFMVAVMRFYRVGPGTEVPPVVITPRGWEDFIRFGLFMLSSPHLLPFLEVAKYCCKEWYNIVDHWDILVNEFFYKTNIDNVQLDTLLHRIMDMNQPEISFSWPINSPPVNKSKAPIDTEKFLVKEEELKLQVEKMSQLELKNEEILRRDSQMDIDMATQLIDNLDALKSMEIPSTVVPHLVPMIVKKNKQMVNISWAWDDDSELNLKGGWVSIYQAGDENYSLPSISKQHAGRLEVNKPLDKNLESKNMTHMLHLMSKKGREFNSLKLSEEEELMNALRIIETQEKSLN